MRAQYVRCSGGCWLRFTLYRYPWAGSPWHQQFHLYFTYSVNELETPGCTCACTTHRTGPATASRGYDRVDNTHPDTPSVDLLPSPRYRGTIVYKNASALHPHLLHMHCCTSNSQAAGAWHCCHQLCHPCTYCFRNCRHNAGSTFSQNQPTGNHHHQAGMAFGLPNQPPLFNQRANDTR